MYSVYILYIFCTYSACGEGGERGARVLPIHLQFKVVSTVGRGGRGVWLCSMQSAVWPTGLIKRPAPRAEGVKLKQGSHDLRTYLPQLAYSIIKGVQLCYTSKSVGTYSRASMRKMV